jgi:transcriptional regulator with XRE-family HTH domain
MTIGELIRQKRKEKKMTLDDLGNYCGVPRSTISRWENGIIKKISRDNQEKLCIILQIDPAVFFYKEEILSRE